MSVGLHTRLSWAPRAADALHAAVWLGVVDAARASGVTKSRIYRGGLDLFHYIECEDYGRALAELAGREVNRRWQATLAPLMEVAHDYSGEAAGRLPTVFELDA